MREGWVMQWKGRPVADLSREELIAALEYVQDQIEREREVHLTTLNFFSEANAATDFNETDKP